MAGFSGALAQNYLEEPIRFPGVQFGHAPSGSIMELPQYANMLQSMFMQRQQQMARDASAQAINERMGTQGQDPWANQTYLQNETVQKGLSQEQEYARQAHEQALAAATAFMGGMRGVPTQGDPYLSALMQMPPSPEAMRAVIAYMNPHQLEEQRGQVQKDVQAQQGKVQVDSAREIQTLRNQGELKLQQDKDQAELNKYNTITEPIRKYISGQGTLADAYTYPQFAMDQYFQPNLAESRAQQQKDEKDAKDKAYVDSMDGNKGGKGLRLPTTKEEQKAQQQGIKDARYNITNQLWNKLPPDELKLYQQDPRVMQTIKEGLLTDNGIDYRAVVPHIYQMVINQMTPEERMAFYNRQMTKTMQQQVGFGGR